MAEKKRHNSSQLALVFWFGLSLSFTAIYLWMALSPAWRNEYIVGKDVREYIIGMHRFSDPQLFSHDLIADYFQSITPSGYANLYHLMSFLGISLVVFSKLLPLLVGLLTTSYGFAVCMQMLPVPMAGFIMTLVLNQTLAVHDDFVSATPRDFFCPLFLAFLYYLIKRYFLPCLVIIALQALFYPPIVLITCVILLLRLLDWQGGKLRLSQNPRDYVFCLLGLGVALVALLPYMMASSEFGPAITNAEARNLPDYWAGGRVRYYFDNPWTFWLYGRDSGMFALLNPPLLFIGVLLPILLKYPTQFPLTQQVKSTVKILPKIALASVAMFLIAHVVAFQLHFPSRYTFHTFQMVLSLACGMAVAVMVDGVFHYFGRQTALQHQQRQILATSVAVLGLTGFILYPLSLKVFPDTVFVEGGAPALYQFLQQQPKESLIASLTSEVDNLPTFAKRPILVGREYALPFHTKYYAQFRQRVFDLIEAQYTPDINQVKSFIRKYGVNFWLVERNAFTPEYLTKNWVKQYPEAREVQMKLKQGNTPALSRMMKRCAVLEPGNSLVLLEGKCMEEEF